MELRVTSLVGGLIAVYALSCSSHYGEATDPTKSVYLIYDVKTDVFYTTIWVEQEENDEGSSYARFIAPAIGFVVFLLGGIIGILIKARRTMASETDILSRRYVRDKVEDIRDTATRLLAGKNEEEKKEETGPQEV